MQANILFNKYYPYEYIHLLYKPTCFKSESLRIEEFDTFFYIYIWIYLKTV